MQAFSDEGMWLFNEPPKRQLREKYQFELTDQWLNQVRLAAVRMNNGGSASFVSPHGLIITNHHVGADLIQKLSTPDKNYYRDGFYARTQAEELKCPDLEINILQQIIDVTDQVNASVQPDMKPEEAFAARRARMTEIENESLEKTKSRSDVITLYQGGAYHLYRYKKYTDVRLVFAPEHGIAFFGGDTDNFEYPRYNLDICLFRAYENDKPIASPHYLKISTEGAKENDLVFVVGNPGTTNRLETVAKLKHRRDFSHPYQLMRLRTFEAAMLQYAAKGPNETLQSATDVHRFPNARKAFSGQYQGLLDPKILQAKFDSEKAIRDKLVNSSQSAKVAIFDGALDRIAEIQKKLREFEKEYLLIERGDAFSSDLFSIARHLVRLETELKVENSKRLREYRESNLESLKFQLFSPAPIYLELERMKLTTGLTFLAEQLGAEHPLVVQLLAGLPPARRADEILAQTKLINPDERKKLFESSSVSSSNDSMIQFAKSIDEAARKLRSRYENEIEEPERQAFGELSKLRFEVLGREVAPDATFSLRIAYGTVKGYTEADKEIPFATTLKGAFDRAMQLENKPPFNLPERWLKGKSKLDLDTPFNFASTADTIGGNSGSPVINRKGEFVGINFDRNRHGLVRNFVYTDVMARHIAVHSRAILESLQKLYDCEPLIKELIGS